jgi:hypothetical protein
MFNESLYLAAAAYAAGWISSNDLKTAANRALDRGIYSHGLGVLATLSNPILSDAGPLFEFALRELQIPIPSKQEGYMIAAAGCIHAILEGSVAPEAGLRALHDYAFVEVFHRISFGQASPDSLREVVALYYEYDHYYDEALDRHARDEVDRHVLARAAAWSLNYGRRSFNPAWLTSNNATVPAIARRIDGERTFHDLPILADALEEAGCADPGILDHCRQRGEHVRGCWVVDLILGMA